MNLFDVYSLYPIEPTSGKGCYVYDDKGNRYLDFYGGHAVISIGHSHPHYIQRLSLQLNMIGFYSNAVKNSLQVEYADMLGKQTGYTGYALFLCNSGAEANENALKLASFHTGRRKMLAFKGSFHGRTSGALAVTDIPSYCSPFNVMSDVCCFVDLNSIEQCKAELEKDEYAAVIIEGIQGVGGIHEPTAEFLQQLQQLCKKHGTLLILDEVQSGCGRTGSYFAHQQANIQPHIVTIAKGIGNGFPMAGVMISPEIKAVKSQLGTTFGGNHLACAAGIAVTEVMENEKLVKNAAHMGAYLLNGLRKVKGIKEVRGKGLMLGIEMDKPAGNIRHQLLFDHHVFTGSSSTHTIRLLPPLSIKEEEADRFLSIFKKLVQ